MFTFDNLWYAISVLQCEKKQSWKNMFASAITIFCSLIWAGVTIATKILTTQLPTSVFAFIRYTLVVLCLFPLFLVRKEYEQIKTTDLTAIFSLGLLLVLIFNSFFFLALSYSSATSVITIGSINPLVMMLLAALAAHFTPNRLQLVAFVLAFIGTTLVVTHGMMGYAVFTDCIGELYALAAVACQTVYAIVLRKVSLHYSPLFVTFCTALTGIIFVAPFVTNAKSIIILSELSLSSWGLFAFISILGSALAIFMYAYAMCQLGPARVSLIAFTTMPIFTAILSYAILGEIPTTWQLVGGSIIIASLILSLRQPHYAYKSH
jgi:drug/metabolite transporter (DMT)-like permease